MVRIQTLENRNDSRGLSCPLGTTLLTAIKAPEDAHLATIESNQIRGNHFHQRNELLVILAEDPWTFAYDRGQGTDAVVNEFSGGGASLIEVPPGVSHAIRNDGNRPLIVLSVSDGKYDPAVPDAHRRTVLVGRKP